MALYHCYSTAVIYNAGTYLALDAAHGIESAAIMWGSTPLHSHACWQQAGHRAQPTCMYSCFFQHKCRPCGAPSRSSHDASVPHLQAAFAQHQDSPQPKFPSWDGAQHAAQYAQASLHQVQNALQPCLNAYHVHFPANIAHPRHISSIVAGSLRTVECCSRLSLWGCLVQHLLFTVIRNAWAMLRPGISAAPPQQPTCPRGLTLPCSSPGSGRGARRAASHISSSGMRSHPPKRASFASVNIHTLAHHEARLSASCQ